MTTAGQAPSSAEGAGNAVARIAAFARKASFETTRLTEQDLGEVRDLTPASSAIYVSAIPSRPLDEQVATSRNLHTAGYEPVPHLAVRNFTSVAAMEDHLRKLIGEVAVVTRAYLVIAGDRDCSRKAVSANDALGAIKSGVLQRLGITEIGISGYPDGHPRIADEPALEQALTDKLKAGRRRRGLLQACASSTQFTMRASIPICSNLVTKLALRRGHRQPGQHRPRRPDQHDDTAAFRAHLRRQEPGTRPDEQHRPGEEHDRCLDRRSDCPRTG